MSYPICTVCAKSGVLCNACEEKLDKGEISELEVELSKLLYDLSEEEIGFERAMDVGDFIIVLTDQENVGKIIGKSGENLKYLSDELGKQLRIIGIGNLQETIHDFVAPARIESINTVYKPDGTTKKRVRINKKDKGKLRMSLEKIEKLVNSLAEEEVDFSYSD